MDLEEWDVLSDEGFIDLHESGKDVNFPTKSIQNTEPTLIDMNYFQKFDDPKPDSGVIFPVPIQFDSHNHNQDQNLEEIPEEVTKFAIETTPPKNCDFDNQLLNKEEADHQEAVYSQVSFKKLKENEFVDMKMDSPKSLNRGLLPQIEVGNYQFEEKEEEKQMIPNNKKEEKKSKNSSVIDDQSNEEGLNVWKWAMTGIGALCSFGFAAATVSLIVLGNRHKESCNNSKKQAELHFQLYSHDKRLKQVVHHATKINEALSAMRGAPVAHAHITIGGYHESL